MVTAVQNPADKAQLRVLNVWGAGLPLLARLLILAALVFGWKTLAAAQWGEEVSWSDGRWIATSESFQRAGTQADPAGRITESRASHKGVIFWCCLLTLIAVPVVGGAIHTGDAGQVLMAGVVIALLSLAIYTLVNTFSRAVQFDDTGISDASFFGVRRVPWDALGGIVMENINARAQQSYDRSSKKSGSRPPTIEVHKLLDRQGREILSMGTDMVPAPLFHDLRARIQKQAQANSGETRNSTNTDHERLRAAASKARASHGVAELVKQREFEKATGETTGSIADDDSLDDATLEQAIEAENRAFEAAHRERTKNGSAGTLFFMILVALPFLAGTGYMCYQSAWYALAAERAEGTIVEVVPGTTPSLTVEYQRLDGSTRRIETDGSAGYSRFRTGDKLSVMYDPVRPDRERVDLFLENWLLVIIVGVITFLIVATFGLIYRQFNAPFP